MNSYQEGDYVEWGIKVPLTVLDDILLIQEYTSNDFSAGEKKLSESFMPSNSLRYASDISCII